MLPVSVCLHEGPLPVAATPLPCDGAGAVVAFEGRVRPLDNDRTIAALDYEIYEPMARQMLAQLVEECIAQFGLIGLCVEHSHGRVEVGQCSFRLQVAAAHRQEALAAMACFIDRMKQDVPIWKTAVEPPRAP
jgi:molybdopterin synthase catalytic subunit